MKLEVYTLNGKPVILEVNKDGKIEIKKEDLDKLIEQAYDAGQKSIRPSVYGLANTTNGAIQQYKSPIIKDPIPPTEIYC